MQQKMDKKTVRQEIIRRRDALSPEERQQRSLMAAKNLLAWPQYQRAKTMFLFAGVRSEIDTRFLTEESLRLGKRVAMPRCVPQTREMLLLEIDFWADLEPSYYGLLEPSLAAHLVPAAEVDLIVVPGLVFSPDGYRVGYGGGYYDRLLSAIDKIPTVGLAFQLQLIPWLPRDTHDKPVDFLATEQGITDCRIVRGECKEKGDGSGHAGQKGGFSQ